MKTIIAFKTHVDVGFTGLASEVVRKYADKLLPAVLETCRSVEKDIPDQKFVWTMPAWALDVSLRFCSDEVRAEAEKRIRNREILWYAIPVRCHRMCRRYSGGRGRMDSGS